MTRIRQHIKVAILASFVPFTTSAALLTTPAVSSLVSLTPYFQKYAPPSFADSIRLTRSTDPESRGWFPNLLGLPDRYQVAVLTQDMINVMMKEKDSRCTSISLNLRMMIFQHFVIYQHMMNAQHVYFNEQIAHQWAHVLGMTLKESSGDSASITDMCGYSISTDDSKANLQQWRQILSLSSKSHVELNFQTNFGLTQTSSDRLMDAFHLSQDQKYDTAFLEGIASSSTDEKPVLNTAIAIRRLIWFYQGFAEGRIVQSDGYINQQEINKPEYSARYNTGLNMALLYCGTRFMFSEASLPNLLNAMASIAYCKLGNQQTGFGNNEFDEQCYAEWVTLCPALNIDIATLTPLSYFATRNQKPVCEDTFKQLIKPAPTEKQLPLPQFWW